MRHFIPRSCIAVAASISLFGFLNPLEGCTYIESQLQRTAPPDTRVKLGWQDRVFVHSNQLDDYTCHSHYILRCDDAGAITMSCTCVRL